MPTAARTARLSAVAALVLAAAWFFLPTSLGGGTSYVTTYGKSMEPSVSTGDLAVLRPAGSYDVGDVVAFHSDALGTTVMHRIVDRDGDRFVTQGDNNSWRDEERPTAEDLHGALWLTVPHGGTALAALTSPWSLAAVGAASALVVAAVRRPRSRSRARGHRTDRPGGRRLTPVLPLPRRALVRRAALASGVTAVLAVTGVSALLLLPDTQTTAREVPVSQDGRLTYTGEAAPGTTYPDGLVTTGDPVYTALAHVLTLSYDHTLDSPEDVEAEGTVALAVELTAPDGWSTELPAGSAVPLRDTARGATATATVELNTAVASGLLAAHYYEVGANGGSATLTVTPQVDVDATVGGRPFPAAAPAPVTFTLEPTALRLAGESEGLVSSVGTTVTVEETVPRVLGARGVTVPIETARLLVLAAALAASLVAVGASWLGAARTAGPAEEFLLKRAGRVLSVARFVPEGTVVDVADPESLYKVAERLDGLVLHSTGPDGDTFAVRDVGTTYRCVLPRAVVVPQPAPVPGRGRTAWLRGRPA